MARCFWAVVSALVLAAPCRAQPEDLPQTMEQVQELVRSHRFQQVIDLLEPLKRATENRESLYIIAAELGRARFHLGDYRRAHEDLRQAVTIHPDRVETALYLQATSYLLGHRDQAFAILEEVLRSGARDRYLAVTLPGEQSFLADPEVWQLLEEYTIPLVIDLDLAAVGEVRLGQHRETVKQRLGASSEAAGGRHMTARAGPFPVWGYSFSDQQTLHEVILHCEPLVKYTPYRPRLGDLDWTTTPAQAIATLGPPDRTSSVTSEVDMTWLFGDTLLTLGFGRPRPPRPPMLADDVAILQLVTLAVPPITSAESDSGSMGP